MEKHHENPVISVIMGIYNCENTLDQAIQSILNQTYTNWELIMIDDGSSDGTYNVAEKYARQYENIYLYANPENKGLNYTLNQCLKYARGKYIARMDGDDSCLPNRFQKEMDAFEENPNISIVSTGMILFDERGSWGRVQMKEFPEPKDLVYGSQFSHSACIVKREAYEAVDGYKEGKRFLRVEDYHLWFKMYQKGFRGMNLQEELYYKSDNKNACKRRKMRYRINECYIKGLVIKEFRLPVYNYIYCLRPILCGCMPEFLYTYLHRQMRKG